jgi:hypothetical protein
MADWERRDAIIEDHAKLVERARDSQQSPWPIQVWKIGEEYVLARGFAALAAAVDAGLPEIRVVVAARFPRWELDWVDPDLIEGTDPLLSKALKAKEKIHDLGWLFPPLVVAKNAQENYSYSLGRGKRAAARLWAAVEEDLEKIPIVVRPQAHRSIVAGTVHIETERIRIVSPRHLRKMRKPLPPRLLNEVASGHLRPIRVRRTADGDYELVDGLLRLRAAKEVGLRAVYAIIEMDLSKKK